MAGPSYTKNIDINVKIEKALKQLEILNKQMSKIVPDITNFKKLIDHLTKSVKVQEQAIKKQEKINKLKEQEARIQKIIDDFSKRKTSSAKLETLKKDLDDAEKKVKALAKAYDSSNKRSKAGRQIKADLEAAINDRDKIKASIDEENAALAYQAQLANRLTTLQIERSRINPEAANATSSFTANELEQAKIKEAQALAAYNEGTGSLTDLQLATKEVERLNELYKQQVAYEQASKLSIAEQLKLTREMGDLLERNNKAREGVKDRRKQANFNRFRGGFDITGGIGKAFTSPLSSMLDIGSSIGNKAFDDFIESNQAEIDNNIKQMSANDEWIKQKQQQAENEGRELTPEEKKQIKERQDANKSLENKNKELGKSNAKAAIAQNIMNTVAKSMKTLLKPLSDFKNSVVAAAKAMLDMKTGIATYSSGSLVTNASARETKLKYGMNDATAYGFDKAKSLLNIQSDEDLMYMNADQRNAMLGYMQKYSAWYEQMESSGVLRNIQEMQLDFEMMKEEIAMEFLQWIAENKDTIMTCIRGIFTVVKGIADMVLGIIELFGGRPDTSAWSSDVYNAGTTNNSKTNNVNINVNQTNNNSGGGISTPNDKMWSDLAKQIVTATE